MPARPEPAYLSWLRRYGDRAVGIVIVVIAAILIVEWIAEHVQGIGW